MAVSGRKTTGKTSARRPSAGRRKYKKRNDTTVLRLLILVAVVLVVFEGRLVYTMFTQSTIGSINVIQTGPSGDETTGEASVGGEDFPETPGSGNTSTVIAGWSADGSTGTGTASLTGSGSADSPENGSTPAPQTPQTGSSTAPSSSAIVPMQPESKDDSFFSNAVFIGDSRMEGFRNASGITQGTFMTAVGMSIDELTDTTVLTSEGNITVYQGLSGRQYDKIYVMLGTNDLGYYPWELFLPEVMETLETFHELQPDAIVYVCSVIYVEEAKTSTDYVNNQNVNTVNSYLLEACEDLDYCHYINLNEIFDNGWGSLIEDASSDGVHLSATYLEQMLDYLKCHYIPQPEAPAASAPALAAPAETEAGSETEMKGV